MNPPIQRFRNKLHIQREEITIPGSSVNASNTSSEPSLPAAMWRGVKPAGPTTSGLSKKLARPPSTIDLSSDASTSETLSGTYLNRSSTRGLEFLRTALWRRPISMNARFKEGYSPAPTVPSSMMSKSFLTTAHQSRSMENSISHLNRLKEKRSALGSKWPNLDFNWLLWRSQPISCIKSIAWFLVSNFPVPQPSSSMSVISIVLSSIQISEQTSFSATIMGKKLLLRPWSSTWIRLIKYKKQLTQKAYLKKNLSSINNHEVKKKKWNRKILAYMGILMHMFMEIHNCIQIKFFCFLSQFKKHHNKHTPKSTVIYTKKMQPLSHNSIFNAIPTTPSLTNRNLILFQIHKRQKYHQ